LVKAEPAQPYGTVTEDEIRLHAFWKWDHAGRPAGDGVRFWLEAEQELVQDKRRRLGSG
jgi:hypothetical protein